MRAPERHVEEELEAIYRRPTERRVHKVFFFFFINNSMKGWAWSTHSGSQSLLRPRSRRHKPGFQAPLFWGSKLSAFCSLLGSLPGGGVPRPLCPIQQAWLMLQRSGCITIDKGVAVTICQQKNKEKTPRVQPDSAQSSQGFFCRSTCSIL